MQKVTNRVLMEEAMYKSGYVTVFFGIVCVLLIPSLAMPDMEIRIEFTQVPPAGAGAASQGDIAGKIVGLDRVQSYKIVLYAHTDRWYVQPLVSDPYTDIDSNGQWNNWTHLGHRYAALVVRSQFRPPANPQSLPRVGGDVIARSEVVARSN